MDFLTSGQALPLLVVMLGAALLALVLGERLRVPGTVLLVVVGLFAGLPPFGLSHDFLQPLSSVGLVFAFFLVGCEVDTARLSRADIKTFLFAGAGFVSSVLLGWIVGTRVFGLGTVDALLLGTAFSAASPFPKYLESRLEGVVGRDAGALLGANDLGEILRLGAFLVLLALRSSLGVAGTAIAVACILAASALAFSLSSLLASLWLGRTERSAGLGFLVMTAFGLSIAALAGSLGLPPPVGALVAGLTLGRFEPQGSLLDERLGFAAKSVFLPLALVPGGMVLAGILLGSGHAWLRDLPLAALAAVGFAFLPRLLAALSFFPLVPFRRLRSLFVLAASPGQEPSTLIYLLFIAGLGILGLRESQFLLCFLAVLWLLELLGGRSSDSPKRQSAAVTANVGPFPRHFAREGARGEILVALSNPGTAVGLIWLACNLRVRSSQDRVRAIAICESEESERGLERAEHLLAQALVQARDLESPLEPLIAKAPTVAEGLLKAALQGPAGTIILGLNRAPHPTSLFAAGIHETLFDGTDSLVIVAGPGRGFAGIDRLALVLPPGVESRLDAARVAGALTPLLATTGASLIVYVQKPGGPAARTLTAIARPRGEVAIEELDSWKDAARVAKTGSRRASGSRTGYAILSGRPGLSIWHPSFKILPRDFVSAFPDSPLMILYPPAVEEGSDDTYAQGGLFEEALDRGRILVGMGQTTLAEGIRALLSTEFGDDRRKLARFSSLFADMAQKETVELEPGVMLLHAHISGIPAPLLFFGGRPEGWSITALEEPIRVLVILCAPEGQRPDSHLAILGELASLFRDRDLGERMAFARRLEDLREPSFPG